jgi:two-component system, response regulator PdtaR
LSYGRKVFWMALAVRRPVVLIVKDELLLRISAAEMVDDAGFEVVEAGNADEAIAILEIRLDIEIVFTDIQMPGSMDGLKLARFVRDRWPPVKLVATSGLLTVSEGDLPEGVLFIGKPYTTSGIAEVLRSLAALT